MHTHDGDEELFGVLRQMGVDFSRLREFNFYFAFPSEAQADQASRLLVQKGLAPEKFPTEVPAWKRLFTKPEWMLSVTKTMKIDETEIKNLTTQFQQIATQFSGDYDGWEANVSDDQIDADQLDVPK